MPDLDLRDGPDGVVLRVRAAPGASRDAIVGVHGGALKVAVSSPPEKGKANQRIIEVLAKELGLPTRCITLVAGTTARDKRLVVADIAADELRRKLDHRLSP